MGEYIYVHLLEHFLFTEETLWLSTNDRKILQADFERRKHAIIGSKAPVLSLTDEKGDTLSIYNHPADYTILLFWDPKCTSCKDILYELAQIIEKYSFLKIKVFTVCAGDDQDIWKAFLAKKVPSTWSNTFLSEQKGIIDSYNVTKIPSLFLLDKNLVILDKNYTLRQLDNYLFQIYQSQKGKATNLE